jgi:hypothetical protein
MHAVTAAHNMLAAMIDNHLFQGNALGIDWGAAFAPRELAETPLVNGGALSSHHHRRTRVTARFYPTLDDTLNGGQPAAGHANIGGCFDWQTIASTCHRQGG